MVFQPGQSGNPAGRKPKPKPPVIPPPPPPPPLDTTGMTHAESADALLARAVERASTSSEMRDIVPVLDALLKRGFDSRQDHRVYDIRAIMSLMTDEQLAKLEELAK